MSWPASSATNEDRQHVVFSTQELSNIAWALAVLSSEGMLRTEGDHHLSPSKSTAVLDAGEMPPCSSSQGHSSGPTAPALIGRLLWRPEGFR